MSGLGARQIRILELLEDEEWWDIPQIRTVLEAEGMVHYTSNYNIIYMALTRLESRGLVESCHPKTFGPPIRLWAKTIGSRS